MVNYNNQYISAGDIDYTESEQHIVNAIDAHGRTLPYVALTDCQQQLIALARCYRTDDRVDIYLCYRLSRDNWLPVTTLNELIFKIEDAISPDGCLDSHLSDVDFCVTTHSIVAQHKAILRDVWIKQILANYGTTVEQQLALSKKWHIRLVRWWKS